MKRIVLWSFVLLLIPAPSVEAMMMGLSTAKLTRDSELVVMGKVLDVRSHWADNGRKIRSTAHVQVKKFLKGSTPVVQVMEVVYDGGEVGDIGMKVSDVSPLRKGEEVILFLKKGRGHTERGYHIVGKGQGTYRVENGIARKGGFSIARGHEQIDNDIPVPDLIDKIKKADR
jgi:hypothetical protein